MASFREHGGRHYAVVANYSAPDSAWFIELSETQPAAPFGMLNAPKHVVDEVFLWAVVPDEDPALEPTIHFRSSDKHVVPFEAVRRFLDFVSEEVRRCHALAEAVEAPPVA